MIHCGISHLRGRFWRWGRKGAGRMPKSRSSNRRDLRDFPLGPASSAPIPPRSPSSPSSPPVSAASLRSHQARPFVIMPHVPREFIRGTEGNPMNTVLVGAQWGDEGKGKIIDVLTAEADIVVRYQGGSNAGHTVVVGDKKYVLHLVPSGVLHAGKSCVIGNGVVMNPFDLMKELKDVQGWGFDIKGRFFISSRAHMV